MKYCFYIGCLLLLFGCANTPNNIVMQVSQGTCVPAGTDLSLVNTPAVAPYCLAVTIQNNNTGNNANNVQITSSGLTLSYSANVANGVMQNFSGTFCDFNASGGVCTSNTQQQIGNIKIYDPNNCATQQGGMVTTLMANGGKCTFYLQIVQESYAFGQYPISLTYNYTNANQNFSVSTSFTEVVNAYAGGDTQVYTLNQPTPNIWHQGIGGITTTGKNTVLQLDQFGNIYFNIGTNIYLFNGLSANLLSAQLDQSIKLNNLAIDLSGNLLAGTNNGIYGYNNNLSSNWQLLNSTVGINNLQYLVGESFVATTQNEVLNCNLGTSATLTLICTLIPNSPQAINALLVNNTGIFIGNNVLNYYNNLGWATAMFDPNISNTANVSAFTESGVSNILVGLTSNNVAIYSCNILSQPITCVPVVNSQNYSLMGNVFALATDGALNIYAVGQNLTSSNSVSLNSKTYASFLLNNIPNSLWQGIEITGGALSLNTILIASELVSNEN